MKKIYVMLTFLIVIAMFLPACTPAKADCASEEVFCVGLVTDGGKVSDQSLNQATWDGVQQAEADLGARIEYIETADAGQYAQNIATFGDQGYDVIVTVGFALAEATLAAAPNYPDTDFIGVDQIQVEVVDGVAGLNFPEDQAGFLVGAMGALISKSNKIGAVCAEDAIPAAWRVVEGYKAGAAFADKLKGTTTEVLVIYPGIVGSNETYAEWGAVSADSIIDQGVDTIFGCGGASGDGAIRTAAQSGAYTIGMGTDQYLTLPEASSRMLSSAVKHVTPGVFELIKLSKEEQFPSGNYLGDVGYAPFHELASDVPLAVKNMMEQIHEGLLNGSIRTNVPLVRD